MAKLKNTPNPPAKQNASGPSLDRPGDGGELHQATDQRDHTLTTNPDIS